MGSEFPIPETATTKNTKYTKIEHEQIKNLQKAQVTYLSGYSGCER
jgi:hypothetical protein